MILSMFAQSMSALAQRFPPRLVLMRIIEYSVSTVVKHSVAWIIAMYFALASRRSPLTVVLMTGWVLSQDRNHWCRQYVTW